MRFSELMRVVGARGVKVVEVRAGLTKVPTPRSDGSGGNDPEVIGVCDDSRKVKPGDVFVARSGTKLEGMQFLIEALNRGAVAVVAEAVVDFEGIGSARVENANLALALLAHEVAGNPTTGIKMIGVTGTKGKTTVAYLMRSVLKAAGHTVGMVGTVEIDDGKTVVPAEMTTPGVVELVELFSRMKRNGVTHCVMEVSSHALHQDRVAGIDWAVGMFTNLTGDHLDYHGTMEAYGAAKAILFRGLGRDATAVVNVDDAWGEKMVEGCRAKVVRYRVAEDGKNDAQSADWVGHVEELSPEGMYATIREPSGDQFPVMTVSLIGRHNLSNILATCAAAVSLEIKYQALPGYFRKKISAPPGRLESVWVATNERQSFVSELVWGTQTVRRPQDFSVFVDYAHTHDSLENVLKALRIAMQNDRKWMGSGTPKRLICVFGCGGDRDRTKRPKMGKVAQTLADMVIVTSDNPRTEEPGRIIEEVCAGFEGTWKTSGQITVEPDRRAAIRRAIETAQAGDVVLIAGKGHENYQIIGTTKHHFDDVEEAKAAIEVRLSISK